MESGPPYSKVDYEKVIRLKLKQEVKKCPTCGSAEGKILYCSNSFHLEVKEETQDELWDFTYGGMARCFVEHARASHTTIFKI